MNKVNEIITEVGHYDVLCGRGKPLDKHPGNQRMRDIIRSHKAQYERSNKEQKSIVIESVVSLIKSGDKVTGPVRFLKKAESKGSSNKRYREASPSETRSKVAHCLRERFKKPCAQLKSKKEPAVPSDESISSATSFGMDEGNPSPHVGSDAARAISIGNIDPFDIDDPEAQDLTALQGLGMESDDILEALRICSSPLPFRINPSPTYGPARGPPLFYTHECSPMPSLPLPPRAFPMICLDPKSQEQVTLDESTLTRHRAFIGKEMHNSPAIMLQAEVNVKAKYSYDENNDGLSLSTFESYGSSYPEQKHWIQDEGGRYYDHNGPAYHSSPYSYPGGSATRFGDNGYYYASDETSQIKP